MFVKSASSLDQTGLRTIVRARERDDGRSQDREPRARKRREGPEPFTIHAAAIRQRPADGR